MKYLQPASVLFTAICLLMLASCKKNEVDLQTTCFVGKGLSFREYCENTFLVQLTDRHAGLGVSVEHDGRTYDNVIKIAGGNLTLYDGFSANESVFLKLRTYDEEADQDLVAVACPTFLPYASQYQHVPIYVSTSIGFDGCPDQ